MIDIYLTWLAVMALVVGVSIGMFFVVGGNDVYYPSKSNQWSISPKTGKLAKGFANKPGLSDFLECKEFNIGVHTSAANYKSNVQMKFNQSIEYDNEHFVTLFHELSSGTASYLTLFKRKREYGQYEALHTVQLTDVLTVDGDALFKLQDGTIVCFYPNQDSFMTFGHITVENTILRVTNYVTTIAYGSNSWGSIMLSSDGASIYTFTVTTTGVITLYRLNADAKGELFDTISVSAPGDIAGVVDVDECNIFPVSSTRNVIVMATRNLNYLLFDDSLGGNRVSGVVRNTVHTYNNTISTIVKGAADYEFVCYEYGDPQISLLKCKITEDVNISNDNVLDVFSLGFFSGSTRFFYKPVRIDYKTVSFPFVRTSSFDQNIIFDTDKFKIISYTKSDTSHYIYFGQMLTHDNLLVTTWAAPPPDNITDRSTANTQQDGFVISTYYIHPTTHSLYFHSDKGDQSVFSQYNSSSITRQSLGKVVYMPEDKLILGQRYYYGLDGEVTTYVTHNESGVYGEKNITDYINYNTQAGIAISDHKLMIIPEDDNIYRSFTH